MGVVNFVFEVQIGAIYTEFITKPTYPTTKSFHIQEVLTGHNTSATGVRLRPKWQWVFHCTATCIGLIENTSLARIG